MASILIVDDSRTSRKILRGILEDMGHTIIGEAKNGEEGVAMFKELRPDAVTMDITMPVMDGVTAMKQIHAVDANTKIITITASGQRGKIIECLKDGACEFITKPYVAEEIKETIKKKLN